MEKVKIIYIIGLGHSGSTILDLIIGSCPEVYSLGELAFYSYYRDFSKEKNLLCTCKQPFHKCEFWNDLNRKQYQIYDTSNLIKRMKNLFPYLIFLRPEVSFKKPEDDSILFFNEIYKKAKKIYPETVYLLDSSKSLIRYLYLHKILKLDVYPILLIRDGRGVINSHLRWKNKKGFLRFLVQWIVINFLAKRILKRNPNFIHISYDRFCKNTKDYIKMLNKKLNINISEDSFLEDREKKVYHNVDGNRIRFQKITEIRHDEKWKKELSLPKKIVSTVLLYPFNQRWVHKDSVTN